MTNEVKDVQQLNTQSQPKRKQHKAEKAEAQQHAKSPLWVQIRLFPIWLRIILILALLLGAIAAGLVVGYGYIGDGKPADALKWDTWQHILDIMNGKES